MCVDMRVHAHEVTTTPVEFWSGVRRAKAHLIKLSFVATAPRRGVSIQSWLSMGTAAGALVSD